MSKLLPLIVLVFTCLSAWTVEDPAVAQFRTAMSGQDQVAKRTAMAAVLRISDDDVVLPLLIQGAGDRQLGSFALTALRNRTGLNPLPRGGGPGYPGFPATDDAAGWSAWATARTTDLKQKAAAAATARSVAALKEKVEGEPAADPAAAPTAETPAAATPPSDTRSEAERFGGLDRIIFTDGGILMAYVVTKRSDLEGRLTSIRVVHPGGGGQEDLDAALISRIDEDVR